MNFKDRLLAITDIETTGDITSVHEILEIGLVLCHPKTLEILYTLNVKIKPEHIENNVPAALERNGYKEENWFDALSLKDAMEIYSEKTKDAVFYAYNVTFDWGFINEAFRKTGIKNTMDYHRFDIMSMAFYKLDKEIESFSMNNVSKLFGLPEELMPHTALNGAMQAYYMLKKI
jgi:DNA polymerase III alpha subunit (gram-positive type)